MIHLQPAAGSDVPASFNENCRQQPAMPHEPTAGRVILKLMAAMGLFCKYAGDV